MGKHHCHILTEVLALHLPSKKWRKVSQIIEHVRGKLHDGHSHERTSLFATCSSYICFTPLAHLNAKFEL